MSTTSTKQTGDINETEQTFDVAASEALVERQLDQLMPKPPSQLRRWIIATTVFAVVVVLGVLWTSGRVVPNPFVGGGHSISSFAFTVDAEHTSVETRAMIRNGSDRTVRLTAVDLQGLELSSVTAVREPLYMIIEGSCQTSADGLDQACGIQAEDGRPVRSPEFPLPISIAPGEWIHLFLDFAVTDCGPDLPQNWGRINATFDFGDGVFPPVARTYALGNRLLRDDESSNVSLDRKSTYNGSNQFKVTGSAELRDTLCELTKVES